MITNAAHPASIAFTPPIPPASRSPAPTTQPLHDHGQLLLRPYQEAPTRRGIRRYNAVLV
jgi:hypothetical protein